MSNKYVINLVKGWGQSEDIDVSVVRSGNIPEKPFLNINDIRIYRLLNYANILIKKYVSFVRRPDLEQNQEIIVAAKVSDMKEFPDLTQYHADKDKGNFYDLFEIVKKGWKPEDAYYWILSFILHSVEEMIKHPIGMAFAKSYLDEIFKIEQFGYWLKMGNDYIEENDYFDGPDNKDEIADELEADDGIDIVDDDEDNIIIS